MSDNTEAQEDGCPACNGTGIIRSLGRDNDEIIEDCPRCSKPAESQAAGEPTKEELAFVRRMQHFYCDNIVEGCPTGDWHIESTPAQAVGLLRMLLAAEKLADQVRLAAAQARIAASIENEKQLMTFVEEAREKFKMSEARIASLTGELDACAQHVKIKQERIDAANEANAALMRIESERAAQPSREKDV